MLSLAATPSRHLLHRALVGLCLLGCGGSSGPLFTQRGTVTPTLPGLPNDFPLTPREGDLVLSRDGETVEGLDINGCVRITASDVTLRNCRIRCLVGGAGSAAIWIADGVTGVLLEALDVDGTNQVERVIHGSGFVARRVDLQGGDEGIRLTGGGRIEDSVIHALNLGNVSGHGVALFGGSGVFLERNHIEGGVTSALFFSPSGGPIDDVHVTGSTLGGGAYTVYAGSTGADAATTRMTIEGNRFERTARFGPASLAAGDIRWNDNRWVDTGMVITP